MTVENPKQYQAAGEFNQQLLGRLMNGKGVHAETAVSSVARMAGTFLLRASGLPMASLKPGSPVFSDLMNEQGPELLGVIDQALASMGMQIDGRNVVYDLPPEHDPHLSVTETQALLEAPFRTIAGKHGLTEAETAGSLAISTALLIQKCAAVLDPRVAYAIAAYGVVEGCKTVPAAGLKD